MPIVILGVGGDLTHLTNWRALDAISDIGIVIAIIGLFSYSFNISLLSRGFWKLFFGLYLIENLYELAIRLVPQSTMQIPSFLVGYNTKLNFGQPSYTTIAIMFIVVVPMLYAIYQLANKNTR